MPLTIGIAGEIAEGEKRVALVPEVAKKLGDLKVRLTMESLAGLASHYKDTDYAGVDWKTSADEIYADKASIVGSIGVIMDGWGFTGTMEKLGVERRALTAGENKAFLDPFSPEDEKQKKHAQTMLGEIHQQFIDVVRKGRGKRLKEGPDLFTGLMWTGAKSIELGLSDGFGSVDFVAREVIKAEDIVDYTQKENFAERFAKRFGATMARAVANLLLQPEVRLR